MAWSVAFLWRVTVAFLYGIMLGVLWECASMGVLLLATLLEHFCGTLIMAVTFVSTAAFAVSVAARADLARPLFSILAFRLSAQIAMTIGTGSVRPAAFFILQMHDHAHTHPCDARLRCVPARARVCLATRSHDARHRPRALLLFPCVCVCVRVSPQLVLTTIVSDTPACTSSRLRSSGWRAPIVALLKLAMPKKALRRVVGVEPPYGPPFLRVLAAVASKEWLGWMPTFGMPSLLQLPGTITFRPDRPSTQLPRPPPPLSAASVFDAWMPGGEVTGVYTYACQDAVHSDFFYIFRYQKGARAEHASSPAQRERRALRPSSPPGALLLLLILLARRVPIPTDDGACVRACVCPRPRGRAAPSCSPDARRVRVFPQPSGCAPPRLHSCRPSAR